MKGIGVSMSPDIRLAGKALSKKNRQSFSAMVCDLIQEASDKAQAECEALKDRGKRKIQKAVKK